MQISQQLVLVTGGARGLGVAIVRALHREGAKVVINYRQSGEAAAMLSDRYISERFLPDKAVSLIATHVTHRYTRYTDVTWCPSC